MNLWKNLSLKIHEDYFSVVEIPRGTNAKYEYNHLVGVFELDRCLVTAMNYPTNYGFMPQTIAPDGDPLDCMIFTDVPLNSGTVVRGIPLAVLKMLDKGQRDDKILFVPKFNTRYSNHKEIKKEYLDVYEDFFRNYKNLTSGSIEIIGWGDKKEAEEIIAAASESFKREG